MTLIEGVGDELTITITLLVLFVTLVAAWASTRVTESRLTLTQSQLNGLRVELNELTSDDQSDEEIGSSTESTDAEQHLSDEPPPLEDLEQPVADCESGAEGGVRVVDVGAGGCSERVIPWEVVHREIEESKKLEEASSPTADVDDNNSGDQDRDGSTQKVDSSVQDKKDGGKANTVTDEDSKNVNTTSLSERTIQGEGSVNNQSQRTNVDETDHIRTSSAGDISLKIKFLNETERIVRTRIEETVGNFKRLNFAEESQGGRVVHLIFNGQFLRDDNRQLGSYSVVDNCVLHCHISQRQQSPGTAAQQQMDQPDLDLGQFMVPLFACTIGFVWYLRWQYSYMFNTMSTMSLTAVTVLFMLAVLAAWRG